VTSVQSGVYAVHVQTPWLVVTELDLPDAEGLEMIAILRRAPATRDITFMVVTRRSAIRDKVSAFQAGAADYLVKPVDPVVFSLHVQLLGRLRRIRR
jgi:DNA-binding response OmpR family regulator